MSAHQIENFLYRLSTSRARFLGYFSKGDQRKGVSKAIDDILRLVKGELF